MQSILTQSLLPTSGAPVPADHAASSLDHRSTQTRSEPDAGEGETFTSVFDQLPEEGETARKLRLDRSEPLPEAEGQQKGTPPEAEADTQATAELAAPDQPKSVKATQQVDGEGAAHLPNNNPPPGNVEAAGDEPPVTASNNAEPKKQVQAASGAELAFGTRRVLRLEGSEPAARHIHGPEGTSEEARPTPAPANVTAAGLGTQNPSTRSETTGSNARDPSKMASIDKNPAADAKPESARRRQDLLSPAVLTQEGLEGAHTSSAKTQQDAGALARARFAFAPEQQGVLTTKGHAASKNGEAAGVPTALSLDKPNTAIQATLAQTQTLPVKPIELSERALRRLSPDAINTGPADTNDIAAKNATVQKTPVQPAFAVVQQTNTQSGAEKTASTLSNVEGEPLLGTRSEINSGPIPTAQQHVQATAPTAYHVARQIAQAMQHMPNRPVEITLSPEELGKVRMALSSTDGGLVVNVLTERPETGDLMRRHISNLETAFQDIGYSDISFSFSGGTETQGESAENGSNRGENGLLSGSDEPAAVTAEIVLNTGPQEGLDLRL